MKTEEKKRVSHAESVRVGSFDFISKRLSSLKLKLITHLTFKPQLYKSSTIMFTTHIHAHELHKHGNNVGQAASLLQFHSTV